MTKKTWLVGVFSIALALTAAVAIALIGESNVLAQSVVTGDWRASLVDDNARINLNFEKRSEKAGKHSLGQTYDLAELGLTREQVVNGGPAKFSLVREAGTIDCEGSFQNGKGSGTFRFTGSQAFLSGMKSRGFDFEKDIEGERHPVDRLFTAAAVNVTTKLADDLLSADVGKLDVGDLFKAAIFKIDSAFMREMKATGFPNMGFEDLVKARRGSLSHLPDRFANRNG